MKKRLKRLIPDRESLKEKKVFKPLAPLLSNQKLWQFNRRAIASGLAIGFFFGAFPIIGQMFLAALLAIPMRANLPIAMTATYISNPFSMPFLFTANYYFGAWLLNEKPIDLGGIDWSFKALMNLGQDILVPLFLGSTVVGMLLALFAFVLLRTWWRFSIILNLKKRRKKK